MPKKVPIRQCVACRERKEKNLLVRIVRTPEGKIVLDTKGKASGRGVYICPSEICFAKAVKTRALSRALECEIPQDVIDCLQEQIKEASGG